MKMSGKPIVHVICSRFYDFSEKKIVVGGVETYLTNLLPLFNQVGYSCRIYQFGDIGQEIFINGYFVKSVSGSETELKREPKIILKDIQKHFDDSCDVLLFADHWMTVKNRATRSLSIQHGIHWDIPKANVRNSLRQALSGARISYNEEKKLGYIKKVVCVDYNFPNWYRAQVAAMRNNMAIIPNFTKIAEPNSKANHIIKIIFARRLVEYRGTRIFADAADKLLEKYEKLEITVAGSGPEEAYMLYTLSKWKNRVTFLQYTSDQSLTIHADKHIAVIPTVGSEGTSLSLLEAMSAQCAVVCTNVGGMTNIVIDRYNGLMVDAGNREKLYTAIESLIEDENLRNTIACRGYETVRSAFSYDIWKERWQSVIADIH